MIRIVRYTPVPYMAGPGPWLASTVWRSVVVPALIIVEAT